MKLNSLVPNARYDLEHGKPSVFEQDNDGSNLYRYNIEPEMGIPDGQTEETQVGWQCCEIRIWEKPTKSNLKRLLLRTFINESDEFKLINSYNKLSLGIIDDNSAKEEYMEYLRFIEDLDEMLKIDTENSIGRA